MKMVAKCPNTVSAWGLNRISNVATLTRNTLNVSWIFCLTEPWLHIMVVKNDLTNTTRTTHSGRKAACSDGKSYSMLTGGVFPPYIYIWLYKYQYTKDFVFDGSDLIWSFWAQNYMKGSLFQEGWVWFCREEKFGTFSCCSTPLIHMCMLLWTLKRFPDILVLGDKRDSTIPEFQATYGLCHHETLNIQNKLQYSF